MKRILLSLLVFIGFTIQAQDCSTFIVESKSVSANCHGGNGKILLTKVQGGSGYGTYKYEWTNGDTTQNLMSVPSGIYSVVVTDSNGCVITLSDTILEPELLVISSMVEPNDGYANITNIVSGGIAPYVYEYYELKDGKGKKNKNGGPKEIEDFDDLDAGYYRVRVIDSVGCTMETEGWVEVKDVDVADKIYLKVYPNPMHIYGIVEYKVSPNKTYVLKFINLSTLEIVYESELNPYENKLDILTKDFENGFYRINIYESGISKYKIGETIKINH